MWTGSSGAEPPLNRVTGRWGRAPRARPLRRLWRGVRRGQPGRAQRRTTQADGAAARPVSSRADAAPSEPAAPPAVRGRLLRRRRRDAALAVLALRRAAGARALHLLR